MLMMMMAYKQLQWTCYAPIQHKQLMDQKMTPQYMALKAGMDSVNKETIAKKVAELTSGTPKDLHEKQLEKKRSLEVSMMLQKVLQFSQEQKEHMRNVWKNKVDGLIQGRPLHKYWAHFDYDMFYIACELLDQPEYATKPCGVGGENSVLCTANYEARKWGIRAAMPTFIAKKICPELILIKPNFQKYQKYSKIFKDTLRKFDQNLESHGLDEAYVDLTPYLSDKSLKEQQAVLTQIRTQIFNLTGLTVSCGVGPNKMLAKIASDIKKPNDQFIVPNQNDAILEFMRDRPIRKIPGIGPVNDYYLRGLQIENCQDLLSNTDVLTICFSELSCQFFIEAALGLGCIDHEFKERKSVGKSETFRPTCDENFILGKIQEIGERVSMELEELEILSINVVLSYQLENYDKKDKSFKLEKYTTESTEFISPLLKYLRENILLPKKKIRLLGARCSQIIKADEWKRKSLQNYFAREKIKTSYEGDEEGNKQAIMLQEIKEVSEYLCPVCNQVIECMKNLARFNRHVDKCLSGTVEPKTETKPEKGNKEKDKMGTDQKITIKPAQRKDKNKVAVKGGLANFLTKKAN